MTTCSDGGPHNFKPRFSTETILDTSLFNRYMSHMDEVLGETECSDFSVSAVEALKTVRYIHLYDICESCGSVIDPNKEPLEKLEPEPEKIIGGKPKVRTRGAG